MIQDATTFRSKEQVLCDLAKALPFAPESLEENRKGRISNEQTKKLAQRCWKPLVLTLVFAIAPFAFWVRSTASAQDLSYGAALVYMVHELAHVKCLFEAHGKMGGVLMLGSFIISLGLAILFAFRIPGALCFDLIAGKVITKDGRVVAREEQTNRPNGRDPIEKYFFSLRYLNMQVNLAAYRALEDGSLYLLYLLPRSEELLSIEPKMDDATQS